MPAEDTYAEMPFPSRGLDESAGFQVQRPLTTPVGKNVRTYEPMSDRARGGSRFGLSRVPLARLPTGHALVQNLNFIVDSRAEALLDDSNWGDRAGEDASEGFEDPSTAGPWYGIDFAYFNIDPGDILGFHFPGGNAAYDVYLATLAAGGTQAQAAQDAADYAAEHGISNLSGDTGGSLPVVIWPWVFAGPGPWPWYGPGGPWPGPNAGGTWPISGPGPDGGFPGPGTIEPGTFSGDWPRGFTGLEGGVTPGSGVPVGSNRLSAPDGLPDVTLPPLSPFNPAGGTGFGGRPGFQGPGIWNGFDIPLPRNGGTSPRIIRPGGGGGQPSRSTPRNQGSGGSGGGVIQQGFRLVQHKSGTFSPEDPTQQYPGAVASGNLLIAVVEYYNVMGGVSSVTGFTRAKMAVWPDEARGIDIWYKENSPMGATSVTFNGSFLGGTTFWIAEYSGGKRTGPLHSTGNSSGTGSSATVTAAPLSTGHLVVAALNPHVEKFDNVTSPFIKVINLGGLFVAHTDTSSSGSATFTRDDPADEQWAAVAASFKLA